tara:strand:+ start:3313 stop:3954 length:642 start_codon:yes stop_codon:yes gene_type:complete
MNYEIRDWKSLFQDLFRSYSGLNAINYVFVNKELCAQGMVRIGKDGPNGEFVDFQILKKGIGMQDLRNIPEFQNVNCNNVFQDCPTALPSPGLSLHQSIFAITPPCLIIKIFCVGLSDDRKWYLFEEVRKCVLTDAGKKEIAPYPNCPKTKRRMFKVSTMRSKVIKLRASEMRDICKEYSIETHGTTKTFLQRAIIDYGERCAEEGIYFSLQC